MPSIPGGGGEEKTISDLAKKSIGIAVVAVVVLASATLLYATRTAVQSAVKPSSQTSGLPTTTTPNSTTTTVQGQPQYQLLIEPQAGQGNIYSLTNAAKTSINMTMYELADTTEEQALVSAKKRGVNVRVILDVAYSGQQVNQAAYNYLKSNGVSVVWAPANTIYHQKTITYDNAISMIGTGNLTSKYYKTGRDYWVSDTNRNEIDAITSTFNTDFTSSSLTNGVPAGNLIWSPGAEGPLVDLINSASKSVWFESEELSDQAVINALAADAKRGVQCEIVMTASSSWATAFSTLKAAGCQVHTYPNTSDGLYIHAKSIIINANTPGANLFVGSQNASSGSLNSNRELGLFLNMQNASDVVSGISKTFNSDFQGAPTT